jgi:hypothetical protein
LGEVDTYQNQSMLVGSIIRSSSYTERLEAEKRVLEDRLRVVNAALEALNANPALGDLLNTVAKALR